MDNKTLLHQLELSGKYVFHGSGDKIDVFEPRQAHDYIDGKQIADDKPGIHASSSVDVAAFMAFINQNNCPKGYYSSFGSEGDKIIFKTTKATLDQLKNPIGYIYVFEKQLFKQRSPIQYIYYGSMSPIQCIRVEIDSLPADIQLMPEIDDI